MRTRKLIIAGILLFLVVPVFGQRGRYQGPPSIADIKWNNAISVSPTDYAGHGSLQGAYDWLAATSTMGTLSCNNRRTLLLSPGLYELSSVLTVNTSNVDIVGLSPNKEATILYAATGDVLKQTCENVRLSNFHCRTGETNTDNKSHNLYIYNERRGSTATTTSSGSVYKIIKTGIGVNVVGKSTNPNNPDEVFIWGGSTTHGWYEVSYVTTTTTTDDTLVLVTDPGASSGDVRYVVCFQQSQYRNLKFSDAYTEQSGYAASSQDDICGPLFVGNVGGIWDQVVAGDNSFRITYLDYPTKADDSIALTDSTALVDDSTDSYGLPMVRIPYAGGLVAEGDWVWFSGVTGYSRQKIKVVDVQSTYFDIRYPYTAFTTTGSSLIKRLYNLEFRPRQFTNVICGEFSIAGDLARKLHCHRCENVTSEDNSFAGCVSFGSEVTGFYRNIITGGRSFALSCEFGGYAENIYCNGPYCFAGYNTGAIIPRGSLVNAHLKNIVINDTTAGKSFAGNTETTTYGGVFSSVLEDITWGTPATQLAGTSKAGPIQNVVNSQFIRCYPKSTIHCTSATTMYAFDNGACYDNEGATETVAFTAPAAVKGARIGGVADVVDDPNVGVTVTCYGSDVFIDPDNGSDTYTVWSHDVDPAPVVNKWGFAGWECFTDGYWQMVFSLGATE